MYIPKQVAFLDGDSFFVYKLGTGDKIRFLKDSWATNTPSSQEFPSVYAIVNSKIKAFRWEIVGFPKGMRGIWILEQSFLIERWKSGVALFLSKRSKDLLKRMIKFVVFSFDQIYFVLFFINIYIYCNNLTPKNHQVFYITIPPPCRSLPS